MDEVPVRDNLASISTGRGHIMRILVAVSVFLLNKCPHNRNLVEVDEECGGDDNEHARECKND